MSANRGGKPALGGVYIKAPGGCLKIKNKVLVSQHALRQTAPPVMTKTQMPVNACTLAQRQNAAGKKCILTTKRPFPLHKQTHYVSSAEKLLPIY